ncbi:MAG: acyltransferase family protein, partial [Clostridiales bacterium]
MDILKRQYYLIDIFKFAFACLIIFLHINFGENTIIDIIRCFSHLGVPFFFVVSGFFMGKKLDNNKLINKFIKRLLLLFLFWTILYFPLIILPEIFSGKSIVTVLITYLQ